MTEQEVILQSEYWVDCPNEKCENSIDIDSAEAVGTIVGCNWCGQKMVITQKQESTINKLLLNNDALENIPEEEIHKLLSGISNLANKADELISKMEAKTNIPKMEIHIKSGNSHNWSDPK